MPTWVCITCGKEVDGRCRPASCPSCGAVKESFKKKE